MSRYGRHAALLRWEQADLAAASLVSIPTIKRLEAKPGFVQVQPRTAHALVPRLRKQAWNSSRRMVVVLACG